MTAAIEGPQVKSHGDYSIAAFHTFPASGTLTYAVRSAMVQPRHVSKASSVKDQKLIRTELAAFQAKALETSPIEVTKVQ